jgi:hypothetical protein
MITHLNYLTELNLYSTANPAWSTKLENLKGNKATIITATLLLYQILRHWLWSTRLIFCSCPGSINQVSLKIKGNKATFASAQIIWLKAKAIILWLPWINQPGVARDQRKRSFFRISPGYLGQSQSYYSVLPVKNLFPQPRNPVVRRSGPRLRLWRLRKKLLSLLLGLSEAHIQF